MSHAVVKVSLRSSRARYYFGRRYATRVISCGGVLTFASMPAGGRRGGDSWTEPPGDGVLPC